MKKVRDKQGYVVWEDGTPKGLLRYNLFWDNTPFCTLLFHKLGIAEMWIWENAYGLLGKRYEKTRLWHGDGFNASR